MRLQLDDVVKKASGKWLSIFSELCITVPLPPGKGGPCPVCGDGEDRFVLDKDVAITGGWFCRQCDRRAGYGLSLVQGALGLSFPETLERVNKASGCDYDACSPKPDVDAKKLNKELWEASKPLVAGDQVIRYLQSRGIKIIPHNVRFCPRCYEADSKTLMPAMVSKFVGVDGVPLVLHRTYLQDGRKADIECNKKFMPKIGELGGGAIRLSPAAEIIGVSEGIETALSASQIFSIPVWAVTGTSLLEAFNPTEGVKTVIIFGDKDGNYSGQSSAYRLAQRLYRKKYVVEVRLPENFKDWNEELTKG